MKLSLTDIRGGGKARRSCPAIKTQTVDAFIAERRKAIGRKGQPLSPATINRDLRHLKAAFRVAHEWGYLPAMPKVRMVREQEKLPRFVTDDHFEAIYDACECRQVPGGAALLGRATGGGGCSRSPI